MKQKLQDKMMTDLGIAGKSEKTCKTYVAVVAELAGYIGRPLSTVTRADIASFAHHLATVRQLSPSSLSVATVALRFFANTTLGKPALVVGLKAPRVTAKAIDVLTVAEVNRLIEAIESPTYYAIASVLYGTGMRIGEALRIRTTDIDDARGIITARETKGRRPRATGLSVELVARLRKFWRTVKPKSSLLFHGADPERHLDKSTIQHAIRAAGVKAKIRKRVTPHVLRHCHATHLLEAGFDVYRVSKLLGHCTLDVTERYLHVSKTYISGRKLALHPLMLPRT